MHDKVIQSKSTKRQWKNTCKYKCPILIVWSCGHTLLYSIPGDLCHLGFDVDEVHRYVGASVWSAKLSEASKQPLGEMDGIFSPYAFKSKYLFEYTCLIIRVPNEEVIWAVI